MIGLMRRGRTPGPRPLYTGRLAESILQHDRSAFVQAAKCVDCGRIPDELLDGRCVLCVLAEEDRSR
jgi:hypothetical protein